MLSLINLSVNDRKKAVTTNLHAVFAAGCIHGLFAPDADLLKPLLQSISGENTRYTGTIRYNDLPLSAWDVSYTDCRNISVVSEPLLVQPGPAALQMPSCQTTVATPRYFRFRSATPGARSSAAGDAIDFSKKILLLHHLPGSPAGNARENLPGQLRRQAADGKTILISSQAYSALRDTCDYIYLYDKKRFPIVVEKADFARFDAYFENVFGPPHLY